MFLRHSFKAFAELSTSSPTGAAHPSAANDNLRRIAVLWATPPGATAPEPAVARDWVVDWRWFGE